MIADGGGVAWQKDTDQGVFPWKSQEKAVAGGVSLTSGCGERRLGSSTFGRG